MNKFFFFEKVDMNKLVVVFILKLITSGPTFYFIIYYIIYNMILFLFLMKYMIFVGKRINHVIINNIYSIVYTKGEKIR